MFQVYHKFSKFLNPNFQPAYRQAGFQLIRFVLFNNEKRANAYCNHHQ